MYVCTYRGREGEREGGMGRKENISNQQRSVGLFNISIDLKFFKVKSWAKKNWYPFITENKIIMNCYMFPKHIHCPFSLFNILVSMGLAFLFCK